MLFRAGTGVGALLLAVLIPLMAEPTPGPRPQDPLSPREELTTFRILNGFRIELVACEPLIIDPVAMAFDEQGRIYVAEMRGYPNKGVATGTVTSGRIKLLEDLNGDGYYEKSTVFAEGLRLPTSVMPYKGGLLVANAPDLIYLKDTNGDKKADLRKRLYTGFHLSNIQQLLNSLQWGMDNYVYGIAGNNGGVVRSLEKPKMPPVTLRGRGIRFHPDQPGSLEPTSGGGQYGITPDPWQQWFTATNSQHLRHIVLPDHYLRRNPALAVRTVTINIPDHGAACKVFRISPFEGWRVERTRRRKEGPGAGRFSPTELVPGGYSTSTCSPLVYTADLFSKPFQGNVFVCDPANNLIHRDILVPNGATFKAKRADEGCEFMASTNNWFRPVFLCQGPDGALYLLDFYREAIETPLSLPDDIKAKLNLQSRKRGRLWRIAPRSSRTKAIRPGLGKATGKDLVKHLAHPNLWWRLNAQRLLIERQDKTIQKELEALAESSTFAPGRAHALWTLHGLALLKNGLIEKALQDPHPGVREQALRMAEEPLDRSVPLQKAVLSLVNDPSARVRFQLAFTLGAWGSPQATKAMAQILKKDGQDRWTRTAVLSSAFRAPSRLLSILVKDQKENPGSLPLIREVATLIGGGKDQKELSQAMALLQSDDQAPWQVAVLDGLGQGLENRGQSLGEVWSQKEHEALLARMKRFFEQAGKTALSDKPLKERLLALRLLSRGPFSVARKPLELALQPQQLREIQMAAIRALSQYRNPEVAPILLASWRGYTPIVRREVTEALFATTKRLAALLTALEKKKVLPNQLEPSRLSFLRKHPSRGIRARAQKVLAKVVKADRRKVIERYQKALDLKRDPLQGKAIFKKVCSTCHQLEKVGVEVGPDLLSALRNKTGQQLLIDILDPSREVDSRYVNYVIETVSGRTVTGLIKTETATSVTIRRAEKEEVLLLRSQIEDMVVTGESLMPENLEAQLTPQHLADLLGYLMEVVKK